jgi:hypothetical protein
MLWPVVVVVRVAIVCVIRIMMVVVVVGLHRDSTVQRGPIQYYNEDLLCRNLINSFSEVVPNHIAGILLPSFRTLAQSCVYHRPANDKWIGRSLFG